MSIGHDFIKKLIHNDEFIISNHARIRMSQRNISTKDIRYVIEYGEIIEYYVDDEPCPSVLFLGFIDNKPFHIVVAQCEDHARIITVYSPEKDKWIEYKIRKDKV